MNMNGRKMKKMMIVLILKDPPPNLLLNGRVQTFKLFGVNVSNNLK